MSEEFFNPEHTEATITVNGHTLSPGESLTVRVALETFLLDLETRGLGDDAHGKRMVRLYTKNISHIAQLIGAR